MDAGKSGSGELNAVSSGYAISGKIMLIAIVVLFTTILFVIFLHLYLRWRTLHRSLAFPSTYSSRRRRHHRRHLSFTAASASDRRGLDPAVFKCLPAVVFSPADRSGEDEEAATDECAVCISEFDEGEQVRLLPRCGHRFHVECIDMWFRSHATCPLCRSAVLALAPALQIAIPEDTPSSSTTLPPDLRTAVLAGEEGPGTSPSDLFEWEIRVEVPTRGLEVEELGFGSKSPGSRRLLLRRLLSGDLMLCRGGDGGGWSEETNLERSDEQSSPPPPPLLMSQPPAISPEREL